MGVRGKNLNLVFLVFPLQTPVAYLLRLWPLHWLRFHPIKKSSFSFVCVCNWLFYILEFLAVATTVAEWQIWCLRIVNWQGLCANSHFFLGVSDVRKNMVLQILLRQQFKWMNLTIFQTPVDHWLRDTRHNINQVSWLIASTPFDEFQFPLYFHGSFLSVCTIVCLFCFFFFTLIFPVALKIAAPTLWREPSHHLLPCSKGMEDTSQALLGGDKQFFCCLLLSIVSFWTKITGPIKP